MLCEEVAKLYIHIKADGVIVGAPQGLILLGLSTLLEPVDRCIVTFPGYQVSRRSRATASHGCAELFYHALCAPWLGSVRTGHTHPPALSTPFRGAPGALDCSCMTACCQNTEQHAHHSHAAQHECCIALIHKCCNTAAPFSACALAALSCMKSVNWAEAVRNNAGVGCNRASAGRDHAWVQPS